MTVALPKPFFSASADHLLDRVRATDPVVGAGVNEHAVVRSERQLRLRHGLFGIVRNRQNHDANFEFVLRREFVIALIVRGHAHDGARAVVHEDVVRDPDRHLFAAVGIDRVAMRIDAVLLDLADIAGFSRLALFRDQLLYFVAQRLVVAGEIRHHRMLRRKLHRSRAENRIDARGKHTDRRTRRSGRAVQFEIDQRAFAAADPVALHGADFFRPALELVEAVEQFVGILRRAHEPLFKLALLDHRVLMPPAAAIHNLFVRQHGRAFRTPVHPALLAIGQSLLEELEEEPLVPAVVLRKAGSDFARPVEGKAQAIELRLHFGDVAQRPLARRGLVLNRCIFRRQAKRIPPHGMEHVVAVHPHVAGQRIADGVVAHMPHVQRARGIGKHFENVIFLLSRAGLGGVERRILPPALEPLRLDTLRVVALVVGTFEVLAIRVGTAVVDRGSDFRIV